MDQAINNSTSSHNNNVNNNNWRELNGEDATRLLYGSPVCFLSVVDHANTNGGNNQYNVMVISWLTTTPSNSNNNDDGLVLCSMNARRHTASLLLNTTTTNHRDVCLSVPVHGMEALVLQVGSTSGRHGSSKFPHDHPPASNVSASSTTTAQSRPIASLSKRAQKRLKIQHQRNPSGIPHLRRVRFGSTEPIEGDHNDTVFAIEGTVAHVHCRVMATESNLIDNDHVFMVARVVRASVLETYWNATSKVFAAPFQLQQPQQSLQHSMQPQNQQAPPWLTFFGSQSFGSVVVGTSPLPTNPVNHDNKTPWLSLSNGKQWSRLLYPNPLFILSTTATTANTTSTNNSNHHILSRLTATNNEGALMFATNNQDLLSQMQHATFVLSVPVQGMEDTILQMSIAKKDMDHDADDQLVLETISAHTGTTNRDDTSTSDHPREEQQTTTISCLRGCIAQLECQTTRTIPLSTMVNQCSSDVVVLAQVVRAHVHPEYWDGAKHRFVPPPTGEHPVYLKQLGGNHHTGFGYVTSASSSCS